MFDGAWKRRALAAEAENAKLKEAIATYKQSLDGIDRRFKERAALMSISRKGRFVLLTFVRDDRLHTIEFVGTWADDIEAWKRDLLAPLRD